VGGKGGVADDRCRRQGNESSGNEEIFATDKAVFKTIWQWPEKVMKGNMIQFYHSPRWVGTDWRTYSRPVTCWRKNSVRMYCFFPCKLSSHVL